MVWTMQYQANLYFLLHHHQSHQYLQHLYLQLIGVDTHSILHSHLRTQNLFQLLQFLVDLVLDLFLHVLHLHHSLHILHSHLYLHIHHQSRRRLMSALRDLLSFQTRLRY